MKKRQRVYSKHMTDLKVQERLEKYNQLLSEMMTKKELSEGPLEGIKVIEIGHANFTGIICSSMLGELGAEVVKIEPYDGDPAREASHFGTYIQEMGIPFLMENRNKKLLKLDLLNGKDIETVKLLIQGSDILIDAMQPGKLDNFGIGYRQCSENHDSLIYLAVSPYGHFTEKARECQLIPDADLTAQAESAYPSLIGDPDAEAPFNMPLKAGIWAAAYTAAAIGVAGVLTALIYRDLTGKGQLVDLASYDALATWQGFSYIWGFTNEKPRTRVGNYDWCLFPYGYYMAKDGYVTVVAPSDADFRGLLKILKRWDLEDDWKYLFDRIPDDPRKLDLLEKELKKEISKYTCDELQEKTLSYSASAAEDPLRSKGFPIVVKTSSPMEVLKEQHWKVRNSFVEIEMPGNGKVLIPTQPPKMSESPLKIIHLGYILDSKTDKNEHEKS